jgi:hypothetical protein
LRASASASPCASRICASARPRARSAPALRFSLGLRDRRRRETPGALPVGDRREPHALGFCFGFDSLPLRRGNRLDLVTLGIGLPANRRIQLLLPANDLLLLHRDLHRLALKVVGHLGFGLLPVRNALLLGNRLGRDEIGDLRRSSRGRVGFQLAAFTIGVGFCDGRIPLGFRFLGQLLRLRLPFARLAFGVGGGDGGFLGGHCLGDRGRPLHFGNARLAERLEVAVLVADVANGERVDA